jgi:hypothetical protein
VEAVLSVFTACCEIALNSFCVPSASGGYRWEVASFRSLCTFNFLRKVQILVKFCIGCGQIPIFWRNMLFLSAC